MNLLGHMSLFNRAKIIDQNFTDFVKSEKFPKSDISLSQNETTISDLISLFESQVCSRHLDLKARTMKEEGKCFYTIASSGHEGNAVFGKISFLNPEDLIAVVGDCKTWNIESLRPRSLGMLPVGRWE